jgi:hypothetical protein
MSENVLNGTVTSTGSKELQKRAKRMKRPNFLRCFFGLAMLFSAVGAFTQEATISDWAWGLETSFGVTPGSGLPNNYSASIQGMHSVGFGFSVDWIKGVEPENRGGLFVNSGLLGSGFLGIIRLGTEDNAVIPYVGGGLGVKFNSIDDFSFAWKADGGVAWLINMLYVKAGVTYDNTRNGLGVSAGVGFKLTKTVSATYRNHDGSTFRRTWPKMLWENNNTPNYVYGDEFVSSEVVRTYQKNTTESSYSPAKYELKTSGGETSTTELRDRSGRTIATATTTTPKKVENVKTADAEMTTYTYLWNVTVTRKWYTRTYYYKDRIPTTQRVYLDTESAVLVNRFSDTRKM